MPVLQALAHNPLQLLHILEVYARAFGYEMAVWIQKRDALGVPPSFQD